MADETIITNSPAAPVTEEARRHDSQISENYKRLLDMASPTIEREETKESTPVASAPVEAERPAFVRVEPTASNTARLADYTAHPAPAKSGKRILFEDVQYSKGSYTTGPRAEAVEAPVYEPVYEPVYTQPEFAPAYAEPAAETYEVPVEAAVLEDEAIPTAATMMHRTVAEDVVLDTESRVGFWSALSVKTKLLIAAVFTAIVVAVMIVCVNTYTLSTLSADTMAKQAELARMTEIADELEGRIDQVTDPDYIDSWAQQNGMAK